MIIGAVGLDGYAYLMGDRQATDGNGNRDVLAFPKLVEFGDVSVGVSGTTRALGLIRRASQRESPEKLLTQESLRDYCDRYLVDALRGIFAAGGYEQRGERGESRANAEMIVIGRGEVIAIHEGWQLCQSSRWWCSVGSAYENADGALSMARRDPERGLYGVLADVGVAVCKLRNDTGLPLDIWCEDGRRWIISEAGARVECDAVEGWMAST